MCIPRQLIIILRLCRQTVKNSYVEYAIKKGIQRSIVERNLRVINTVRLGMLSVTVKLLTIQIKERLLLQQCLLLSETLERMYL